MSIFSAMSDMGCLFLFQSATNECIKKCSVCGDKVSSGDGNSLIVRVAGVYVHLTILRQ